MAIAVLTAQSSSVFDEKGLLELLGGAAGILAILGLLLLLPLYLTQRSEVVRLLEWMDREPDAGTTEFRAIDPAAAPPRTGGRMTPAERVTSERPALARISTAEHEALALQGAPLWRRVVERGPRHPLVLTILALLVAVAIVAAAGLLIRSDDGDGGRQGTAVDPADVQLVVVNAGGASGAADAIGDGLIAKGFDVTATTAGLKPVGKTEVQYAEGQKAAARRVVRALEPGTKASVFDAEGEAEANGADVVVFVGEDAQVSDGGKD